MTMPAGADAAAIHSLGRALCAADDRQLMAVLALVDASPARAAVDELLCSVRPRLWLLRPPRRLSLRRVLTVPMEALLAEPFLCLPAGIRLPRSLLPALFAVVERGLDPTLRAEIESGCQRCSTLDIDEMHRLGRRLWPAAAAVLQQAMLDPRGLNRALAGEGIETASFNDHCHALLVLLRHGEKLAQALLPRDGRLPDPGTAAAPHRTMLLQAAEEGPLAFRCIAAAFLLRAPSPDIVVRMIAQARLSLQRPALLQVVEEVVAGLAQELGLLPEAPRQLPDSLAERRSELALRLAMIIAEMSGQGTRLEALAADAGEALVRQFGITLDAAVLAPLEGLSAAGFAETETVAAIEAAARAARRMEVAGRAMGRGGIFAAAQAAARERIIRLAEQSPAVADGSGAIALPDLVRLLEILSGPDDALAMIEALAEGA